MKIPGSVNSAVVKKFLVSIQITGSVWVLVQGYHTKYLIA